MLKVGIQGIRGSFHEMAAVKYFGMETIELVEKENFRALFKSLEQDESDFIVCAIENTLAGSLLPNYALLEKSGFSIVGETYLPIEQCIMALPGVKIENLEQVWSHPIALLQCEDFLSEYPHILPVEKKDTADCARAVSANQLKNVGAIAAKGAAEMYGLQILFSNIQTHKLNFTRFLVIKKRPDLRTEENNKASVSLQLADEPGTLLKVLEICKAYNVNLTKIQSIPIIGKPYTYFFHFDMEWQPGTDFAAFFKAIEPKTEALRIMGIYKRGNRHGF